MDSSTRPPLASGAAPRPAPFTLQLTLHVNGQPRALQVQPCVTLLDLQREQLRPISPKKGCDHGQCGACTVLVDGKRINSCLKLAVTLDGASVTAIEGLGADGQLDPLQQQAELGPQP